MEKTRKSQYASPMEKADSATFSSAGVIRGFTRGQPLAVTAFVYGLAFGLLSKDVGLSALEAVLMSASVYSGSAQLAALTAMDDATPWISASPWVVALIILVVNARYLLYGATLRPWLGQARPIQAYGTLFVLGDGNWIQSMNAHRAGEQDAGYVLGSGLAMFLGWLSGTLIGSLAGAFVSDPSLLGLDFFLVAFCAAAGIAMFDGKGDIAVVAGAAIASLGVSLVVSGGWAIIAAGVVGAAIAYARVKRAGYLS